MTTLAQNPRFTLPTNKNLLDVLVDNVPVCALIDTGAHVSIMSAALRRRLKKVLTPAPNRAVQVADGGTVAIVGMCSARLTIAERHTVVLFTVIEHCPHELILGLDFLASHSALIDCSASSLRLDLPLLADPVDPPPSHLSCMDFIRLPPHSVTHVDLVSSPAVPDGTYVVAPIPAVILAHGVTVPHTVLTITGNRTCLPLVNFALTAQVLPQGISLAIISTLQDDEVEPFTVEDSFSSAHTVTSSHGSNVDIEKMVSSDVTPAQAEALCRILEGYRDIFDFDNRPLGQTSVVTHRINTGDANPIHRRPYRVSASERAVIQQEVNKMLEKDIIEPSCSPWASPVVLVKKKDGTWRFCVDYRHLNKITKKDVYPLPRIDDALDCLYGATYFSSIDLRSGYWQISVDDMDREKTAFVTPDGLYQFKVMPFGLCNAPATFERMMDSLLQGFKWSTCLCYLDDVIVYSPTFDTHLDRLRAILDVFRRAGLQLNSSKCHFARRQISVLGHLVDASGVRPDPAKIRAVTNFPCPEVHQRRS